MKNTYIALTIGPIVDTILSARKTRELWASSYLFSYIMREIVSELTSSGLEVLLPSKEKINEKNIFGAGLYPDRIYLKSKNNGDFNKIQKTYHKVIEETAKKILNDFIRLNNKKIGKEEYFENRFNNNSVLYYLKNYIKLYSAQLDLSTEQNVIINLSNTCDALDLQNRIIPNENIVGQYDRNPLRTFFFLANWSFLFEDGFQIRYDENKRIHQQTSNRQDLIDSIKNKYDDEEIKIIAAKEKRGFDSLIEISTRELENIDEQNYNSIIRKFIDYGEPEKEDKTEDNLITNLSRSFGKQFRDYHKYIAIVHADGDNIGKIINAIGSDPSNIKEFSLNMLNFADEAAIAIAKYGGAPIYVGGDDMLFIAPVANRKQKEIANNKVRLNIFDLIGDLDDKFKTKLVDPYKKTLENGGKLPSLSYGISITYYKYPLYEAKNLSYSLLESVKHKYSEDKNSINVAFLKHSGQMIPFIIPKTEKHGEKLWNNFNYMIAHSNDSRDFLNSFTYKLELLKKPLEHCANHEYRLEHFFKNNFNENYKSNKKFYNSLRDFILSIIKYYGDIENDDAVKLLYGTLRFIHFIQEKQ